MVGGTGQQPIAQFPGGDAVVLVVVADLTEHVGGVVRPTEITQIAVARVRDDGVGRGRHVVVAQVLSQVQRLELLDAVRPFADPKRRADDRIEVHEDPGAQQLVDLLLADAVTPGQAQQRRLLVCRVVVDVHSGMRDASRPEVVEEGGQRISLLGSIVRPERTEQRRAARRGFLQNTEEVLQAPLGLTGLRPQWIALEVEVDVARIGRRQRGERGGIEDLVLGGARRLLAKLEGGLGPQGVQRCRGQARDGCVPGSQRVDRGHVGGHELVPRGHAHARHQQGISTTLDLAGTRLAPAAGRVPVVTPRGRGVVGTVLVEDSLQRRPTCPVHRDEIGQRVHRVRAVTEQQMHFSRGTDTGGVERVGIRRQLEQRGNLDAARQFRVVHRVRAVVPVLVLPDQEIAEPEEPSVEERALMDHRCSRDGRGDRVAVGVVQPGGRELGPGDGLDPPVAGRELVEHPAFVCRAESRRALEHGIGYRTR